METIVDGPILLNFNEIDKLQGKKPSKECK